MKNISLLCLIAAVACAICCGISIYGGLVVAQKTDWEMFPYFHFGIAIASWALTVLLVGVIRFFKTL